RARSLPPATAQRNIIAACAQRHCVTTSQRSIPRARLAWLPAVDPPTRVCLPAVDPPTRACLPAGDPPTRACLCPGLAGRCSGLAYRCSGLAGRYRGQKAGDGRLQSYAGVARLPAVVRPAAPDHDQAADLFLPRLPSPRGPLRPGPYRSLRPGWQDVRMQPRPTLPTAPPRQAGARLAADAARARGTDLDHAERPRLFHPSRQIPRATANCHRVTAKCPRAVTGNVLPCA